MCLCMHCNFRSLMGPSLGTSLSLQTKPNQTKQADRLLTFKASAAAATEPKNDRLSEVNRLNPQLNLWQFGYIFFVPERVSSVTFFFLSLGERSTFAV